ncbi:MAG: phosphoenolpyruvate--protein phosphotransferase [Gemmatimonadaceae bacterium]
MNRPIVGLPASPGIVVGPVHLLRWEVPQVRQRIIPDDQVGEEIARFNDVVARARARLLQVRDRVSAHAGEEEAAIFDVQVAMLDDVELLDNVRELIHQNLGAEKAFDLVMADWRQSFARHTHQMLRERVADLTDVHIRVLSMLLGLEDHDPVDLPRGSNAILVTHDLTPSLTVQLDRGAIAAIATDAGTRTSHVAILARSLGLPAVVGLRDATVQLHAGDRVILDGSLGVIIPHPTEAQIAAYAERAVRDASDDAAMREIATAEPVTLDGVRMVLRANVDLPDEAEAAASSGAEGVGLMRTEFLAVGRATMPDEDEQFRAYEKVVAAFAGKPVVIRTFDVGGDKLPIGGYPTEANPFLGWRAIRMCLDEPELFKTQLRALLRAAMYGDVRIMLPLIVSLDEVRAARKLLLESSDELTARGVAHRRDVPLGVMIETPAAAIAADILAPEVAFFSIGTNDLVQYTLAVDRGNVNLASRFTPLHPAVLRLIRRTVQAGTAAGLDVAVCGEMASQPLMAFALIGLGVRQLSVAALSVALVKRVIRGISVDVARAAAESAMLAGTAEEVEQVLRAAVRTAFGDAPFLRYGLPVKGDVDMFGGAGA